MSKTHFISGKSVWIEISKYAKKAKRIHVAVPYFTDQDQQLLKFRSGDRLIVNLSIQALKSGATNPGPLLKLIAAGVRIYRHDTLHAKVYVLGRTLVVGSANASNTSASRLNEACIVSTDSALRSQARQFIDSMCVAPMQVGTEYLEGCLGHYRPPQADQSKSRLLKETEATHQGTTIWYLPKLVYSERNEETEAFAIQAEECAAADLSDSSIYETESITLDGHQAFIHKIRRGDLVLTATRDEDSGLTDIDYPRPFLRAESDVSPSGRPRHVIVLEKRKRSSTVDIQDFRKRLPKAIRPQFAAKARTKRLSPAVVDVILSMFTDTGRLRKR